MGYILQFITKASIYLLVFLIPLAFSPWTFEAFEFPKQYILFFLSMTGFVAWLVKMILIDKEVKIVRTQFDKVVFLFFLVAVVSSIFSEDRISSLFGYYGKFSDGLIGIASLMLSYILLVNHVSADTCKNPQKIPISRLLNAFVFSITIVGI